MGFYADHILPHLIAWTMRGEDFVPYRRRVAGQARGRVLEVGFGAGANLPFYTPQVSALVAVEPSLGLGAMARRMAQTAAFPIEHVAASAEALPLDGASFDTVVLTWTLCSVADARRALREMHRVLRPGGRLLFVEHGRAPDPRVQRWQDRLTPIWRVCAGGCHLNRDVTALVREAGFSIAHVETGYMRGPRPMTFTYEGVAAAGTAPAGA